MVTIVGFPKQDDGNYKAIPTIENAKIKSNYDGSVEGFPYFMLDNPLRGGFSGSPVLYIADDDSKTPSLLGIFSGYDTDNNGIVFRSSLIVETIYLGKPLT